MRYCRSGGNGGLREVGCDRKKDQTPKRLPKMKAIRQVIGGIRQLHSSNPDRNCSDNKNREEDEQRQGMKHAILSEGSYHFIAEYKTCNDRYCNARKAFLSNSSSTFCLEH